MATELLERLVIRNLAETDADYSVLSDNSVAVELTNGAVGTIQVVIADRGVMGLELLYVSAVRIASFPETGTPRSVVLEICNELNLRRPGKFLVDGDGIISYCLDWVVVNSAKSEDVVTQMLGPLAWAIETLYSAMARTWAGGGQPD